MLLFIHAHNDGPMLPRAQKTYEELQAEMAALKAKLLARKKGGDGKKYVCSLQNYKYD